MSSVKISDLPIGSAAGQSANSSIPITNYATGTTQRILFNDLVNLPSLATTFAPLVSPSFTGTVSGTFSGNLTGNVTGVATSALAAPASGITGATLAANVVSSSLTSVGTIGTGVWQGTRIGVAYGGTGLASLTAHYLLIGNGTSAPTLLSPSTAGYILTSNGASLDPTFQAAIASGVVANGVTLAMLAQVSTATFLGRTTAATGNVEALTVTQATALLNSMVGDSGSGGTKGLAPAPSAGDAALGKYLKADGTWSAPPGSAAASEIWVINGNGNGSSNTRVRRWSNIQSTTGSAITYADSATLGGSFTINTTGIYSITMFDGNTGSTATFGATRNGTQLTTDISSLTVAQGFLGRGVSVANQTGLWSCTLHLTATDIIRVQNNNDCNITTTDSSFRIVFVL